MDQDAVLALSQIILELKFQEPVLLLKPLLHKTYDWNYAEEKLQRLSIMTKKEFIAECREESETDTESEEEGLEGEDDEWQKEEKDHFGGADKI